MTRRAAHANSLRRQKRFGYSKAERQPRSAVDKSRQSTVLDEKGIIS